MPDGGTPFLRLTGSMVAEMITRAEQAGMAHQTPLLRAVGACEVVALYMPRGTPTLDLPPLEMCGKPAVIVIQDDDHETSGPAGFPVARKALRWARAHIVHGTGGRAWHYEAAVALACKAGSCAVVETSSAKVEEWRDFARRAAMPRRAPGLVLVPRQGAHPIMGTAH